VKAAWGFCLALALATPARAHEIYTGIHGKNGQLCCGGNDCAVTTYRENGGEFEFLTRENHWIAIPIERITFLPIPGDPPSDDSHKAHLCYAAVTGSEGASVNVFSGPGQSIYLYCAFIPPGSI
jgi:hypothetical protein